MIRIVQQVNKTLSQLKRCSILPRGARKVDNLLHPLPLTFEGHPSLFANLAPMMTHIDHVTISTWWSEWHPDTQWCCEYNQHAIIKLYWEKKYNFAVGVRLIQHLLLVIYTSYKDIPRVELFTQQFLGWALDHPHHAMWVCCCIKSKHSTKHHTEEL